MKTTRRSQPFRGVRVSTSCSVFVLGGLGLLATLQTASVLAQTAIAPAGTVPILRGVVSGQAIVNTPTQTATGRLLTIDQATQRAIIDWRSFDIAAGSEVNFRQPSSTASVLNRIYSVDPSLIQGRLTANGQVLLINQNGILFDRGSQVNVQSLVASTLNITNDRFNSGSLATGGLTSPAFAGGYDDQGNTLAARPDGSTPGAIRIGGGGPANAPAAQLTANAGGSILVFAPRIDNIGGMIAAPDGQVLLAAGGKAYLAFPDSQETTLRGFQVEVEAAPDSPLDITNLIRNAGTISADRGNVTLAALAVNQQGRVSATTAIQANGSVFLQARTLGGAQAGTVTLAAGSVTEVMPDPADKATLPESQAYAERRGEIRVSGRTIESYGTLRAAGGKIALAASDANDPTNARVYLGAGSETSVAGNWADVALAENLITIKVTSNELRDAPNQRSGVLRGATVTVDLRRGSPLLDLSGYIAAQARTVGEKAATGGEITIASSGSVIQRSGAALDASGGGFRYAAGTASTTKLLGDDGRIYDIGGAPEQRTYTQVLDTFTQNFARWGQTRTFGGLLYGTGQSEAAYVEGKAGGSISIVSATGLVLDGTLRGGVTAGPTQFAAAPRGASLTIGQFDTTSNDFSPTQRIGNVTFASAASDRLGSNFNVASALAPAQVDNLVLAASQVYSPAALAGRDTYVQQAFDSVEINANGRVVVPDGVAMQGAPGSSLLVRSPRIDVAGSVSMPAGAITLQPVATQSPLLPELAANSGVTLQGSGRLAATGNWVNTASSDGSFVGAPLPSARLNVASDGSTTTTSMLSGGRVTIATNTDRTSATVLERGSSVDVSGGAAIDNRNRITAGDGGSISVANGLSNAQSSDWLQADLSGFAAGNGGRLAISAPRVTIDPTGANGTLPADTTRLAPGLFSDHGFSSVAVNTTRGITVSNGTTLTLRQNNLVVDPAAAAALPTGGDVRSVAEITALRDDQRRPVGLALAARGFGTVQGQATVDIDAGASIVADPKAAVSISAVDGLRMAGRIDAPGGAVLLTLAAPADTGAPDLQLAATASISVAAGFVQRPTDSGLVQGSVFDAGSITIAATNAGVNLARGSQLELSGTSRTVELIPAGSTAVRQQQLDGNAGTLILRSQGATELQSSMHAARGSEQGAGGSFALELNARDTEFSSPLERRIVVTQSALQVASGDPAFVEAAVSVDTLRAAGFERLRLQSENRVEMRGDLTADFRRGIRIDAPQLDVTRDARVLLEGSSVALGQSRDPRRTFDGSTYTIEQQGASPLLPTRAGAGILSVQADTIDLFGSLSLGGVAETRLFAAGDVRLTGRTVRTPASQGDRVFGAQTGSLSTAGNVTIAAAQVYPSTRSDYTVSVADASGAPRSGGFVSIASNGAPAGDVYSAGGRLAVVADSIVQAGTVKAPLGQIDLNAVSQLELAPGSLTSVSANGITVPLGTTSAGLAWAYQDNLGGGTRNPLDTSSADGKNISLAGRAVDVRAGARVDLSGGGDIQALEFVPGSGGNRNTLIQPDTYAIIPRAQLTSMPVDTDIAATNDIGFGLQSARADSAVYDRLRIGSGAVVPAGDYVLLPGRYAVLPGAYLVQLQTGPAYASLLPGQTTQLGNGQTVVAGQRIAGNTGIQQSATVGVLVRPGSAANGESDFTVTTSSYFADLAAQQRAASPRLPLDAGQLAISNVAALRLDGTFATAAGTSTAAGVTSSGRAAQVDISADRIAVVDHASATAADPGVLQLESGALSALGGSLLLGGTRNVESGGTRIAARATEVVAANSAAAPLSVPELLLTATDRIDVRAGSVLSGRGTATGTPAGTQDTALLADPAGALLRLASGGQASVDRGSAVDASRGTISIAAGAVLNADGSLLLDATRTTQSQGRFNVAAGGSVSLASSQVSLGETAGIAGLTNGLVLGNTDLANLATLDNLQIKGYQGIDLYGDARVGSVTLGRLTLDSGELRGHAAASGSAASARIDAREVQIVASGPSVAATPSAVAGMLVVGAERIVVGSGAQRIAGYGAVTMDASSEIVARGTGSLDVAGDWTLRTPRVGVAAGAVQQWGAADRADAANPIYGALRLDSRAGTAGTTAAGAAGGRIAFEGRAVTLATTVEAHSGVIAVSARGAGPSDDVTVAAGGVLDASGTAKNYNGDVITADAGSVSLSSANGAVAVQAGGTVNLAANAAGGDAGRLDVSAARFDAIGTLTAAASTHGAGGSARLDLGNVADFSALNGALARGGFDEAIALRQRSGDLRVAAVDAVRARSIALSTDAGRVDIAGTLDARSDRGDGRVAVDAANGLALSAGSRVLANGTATSAVADAPLADGGRVRLATAGGALDFDAASTIDVSPGAKGATGSVAFVVTRDSADRVNRANLAGTVLGWSAGNGTLAEVSLEADRRYVYASAAPRSVSAADIAGYAADHAMFVAGADAAALLGSMRADGGASVQASLRGGTEIRTAGDLRVAQPWNLVTSQWRANEQPGTLTLRAGGDLTVSSSLGMVNDNIIDGRTWNLRLVGGADLAAADAMTTISPQAAAGRGSVVLQGNAARVRTGTGSIDIAAAQDFRMDSAQGAVYTAGRIGAADTATGGNNRWSRNGGDIAVRAGHDAVGASDEWITEWLRRPRSATSTTAAEWWSYRPNFQQGIGTLGGGDITIDAGNDVNRLSAMLPTTGRSSLDAAGLRTLDVQGGGDLAVRAGRDVRGGSYLVARGAGRIDAGGDVGSVAPTQLFLMGTSSDAVPEQASIAIAAGGSVAVQSANNPTALQQVASAGTGPSFSGPSQVVTFFSYSANSAMRVAAESGDASVGSLMAPGRSLGRTTPMLTDTTSAGAFPATLVAAAFEGDVALTGAPRSVVTYPSRNAQVALLANGTLGDPNIVVSDLSASIVPNVALPILRNTGLTGAFLDPAGQLTPFTPADRIVERASAAGPAFDLQALQGDVRSRGANASQLVLPAASRIRAGRDVIDVQMTLQNLNASDSSEIRADNGDVRPAGIEMRGPGTLVVQAGRNVDVGAADIRTGGASLGALVSTSNNANPALRDSSAARLVVIAGVKGTVDPAQFAAAYRDIVGISSSSDLVFGFYRALNGDPDRAAVASATDVQQLIARDPAYAAYADLVTRYPRLLGVYQDVVRANTLPLGTGADASQATALYALLNRETDASRIAAAGSVADLVTGTIGGAAYSGYTALDQRFPRVFADYRVRRAQGAAPEGLTPILLSQALAEVTNRAVPSAAVSAGNIYTFQSSIQTYGNSQLSEACPLGQCAGQGDIELWAPGGRIVAGTTTTPAPGATIGVVTNGGGAIRSVVGGNFDINTGKVLTAQGGDVLIFSSGGSIDAGRGARTSVSTPPPTRTPIIENGVQVGVLVTLPASASGSGIQTVTSDPDGTGPRLAPPPGNVYLFAPAGTIDAGEAGIRSSGNIVINAQTVLNASNISSAGSSVGVPVVASGSLASSVASSGANTSAASKGAEDTAAAAAAARAATAATVTKPSILSVEVLGFGDKNCKEQDKDCFAK